MSKLFENVPLWTQMKMSPFPVFIVLKSYCARAAQAALDLLRWRASSLSPTSRIRTVRKNLSEILVVQVIAMQRRHFSRGVENARKWL